MTSYRVATRNRVLRSCKRRFSFDCQKKQGRYWEDVINRPQRSLTQRKQSSCARKASMSGQVWVNSTSQYWPQAFAQDRSGQTIVLERVDQMLMQYECLPRRGKYHAFQLAVLTWLVLTPASVLGQQIRVERKPKWIKNGWDAPPFDVTRHIIPLDQIEGGGPPRDAIPALNDLQNLTADQAGRLLEPSDRVLGVFFNDQAKAYPVRILNWHELVNDTVGGRAILVSW
jgi:uncharacterized protein DUF3179